MTWACRLARWWRSNDFHTWKTRVRVETNEATGETTVACCDDNKDKAQTWMDKADERVKVMEGEAVAVRDYKLLQHQQAHAKDSDDYKFFCHRWGDWLALYIERGGHKLCTAVNIGGAQQLTLVPGFVPDMQGFIQYFVSVRDWDMEPIKPFQIRVYENSNTDGYVFWARQRGHMFLLDAGSNKMRDCDMMGYSHEIPLPRVTENYPRPALDDAIRFGGINGTLYMPAGRGSEVYALILRAIEDGAELKRPSVVREPGEDTTTPTPKYRRGKFNKG